jgi:hypothetical protein
MKLSDFDKDVLAGIEQKRAILRRRVDSVARGYTSALFVHGPGGHGKSHIIEEQLDRHPGRRRWRHYNSSMSAAGLIEELCEYSDRTHFFEDMEPLYKNADAQGVLRSALGKPGGGPRLVTWTKAKNRKFRFEFTGGIIIASNQPLDTYGILGAIASRFAPMEWKLDGPELAATIRSIAVHGVVCRDERVTPKECLEVAEFCIAEMECKERSTKVDLRTFCDQALPDYLQWRHDPTGVHWKDVVRSRIQGEPSSETRHDRISRQRQIACECYRDGSNVTERLALWAAATGLKKQPFYDRLNEAKAKGQFQVVIGKSESRKRKSR